MPPPMEPPGSIQAGDDANYNGNDSATVMVSDGVLSDSLVINLTVTSGQ